VKERKAVIYGQECHLQPQLNRWEGKDISITSDSNTYNPPDLKIKVPKKERQIIAERVAAGESQTQVAAAIKQMECIL